MRMISEVKFRPLWLRVPLMELFPVRQLNTVNFKSMSVRLHSRTWVGTTIRDLTRSFGSSICLFIFGLLIQSHLLLSFSVFLLATTTLLFFLLRFCGGRSLIQCSLGDTVNSCVKVISLSLSFDLTFWFPDTPFSFNSTERRFPFVIYLIFSVVPVRFRKTKRTHEKLYLISDRNKLSPTFPRDYTPTTVHHHYPSPPPP